MSKSGLKAAMESLNVGKPLKLQEQRPRFQAPAPVAAETEVASGTPVQPKTKVAPETEVVRATPVPDRAPDVEAPGVSAQTSVIPLAGVPAQTTDVPVTRGSKEAPVSLSTQVSRPIGVSTAGAQDSSVSLEAIAAPKLHNGYTRLPNNILMRMAAGDLLRSEMQIVLLIARFTISFRCRHAPLSKSVLERQSGLGGPAVLQAIASLLAKGLIEKIPGDQYRPNQLGLVFSEEWDFFGGKGTEVSAPTEVAAQSTVVPDDSPPVAGKTPGLVRPQTDFKDIQTRDNNSLSALPGTLKKYFEHLRPAKKRESEWRAFKTLEAEYSAQDIAECLAVVQRQGVGDGEGSQACHSPMAFLSKAIANVLPEVQSTRNRAQERLVRERLDLAEKREEKLSEVREAVEWAMKERAFAKAFPVEEQQCEVLLELLQGLPFRPQTQAGRSTGIGRWWDKLSSNERAELVTPTNK